MKRRITERDNFLWLLGALIFLLFSGAVSAQLQSSVAQQAVNVSLTITMLIAIWSLEQNQSRWLNTKVGMTLIIIVLLVLDMLVQDTRLVYAQLIFPLAFLSLTTYQACRQVLFTGNVDSNKIIGAICIYMLLGVVWAFAYLLAEAIFPGSMHELQHEHWRDNLQGMIYYSMVTLTTTGYGDITPVQPIVRFLAYMESITGVFYTTVLVASLIGAHLSHKTGSAEE